MAEDKSFEVPDSPEGLVGLEASAAQEPPAEWRNTAIQCRQFHTALTSAGFSQEEAMELVKVVIETAAKNGLSGNDAA